MSDRQTAQSVASAPIAASDVMAGVLVGGRSLRMGSPKACLPHPQGGSFADHALRVASALSEEVVVLGEPPTALVLPREQVVLRDAPGRGGPLAGLLALLACAGDRWSLLLACDMPFLTPETLRLLLTSARPSMAGDPVDAIAFNRREATGAHACAALYAPSILPIAKAEYADGRGSLNEVLSRACTLRIDCDSSHYHSLHNVNTPDDIDACRRP